MPTKYPVSLAFRLDEESAQRLAAVATAAGMAPSAFARKVVLDAVGATMELPQAKRSFANGDLVRAVLGELGRQGSNLNQAVRALNAIAGQTSEKTAAMAAIAAMQGAYEETMIETRSALGGRSGV